MDITRVVIRPVEREDKVKAMASITIDDSFAIHGLRVVDGEKGLFVAMPSRRLASGEYRDIAHPINTETREMIQNAVLDEFKKVVSAPKTETKEEAAATPLMEEGIEVPATEEKTEVEGEDEKIETETPKETAQEKEEEKEEEKEAEEEEEEEVGEEAEESEEKTQEAAKEEASEEKTEKTK